MSAFTHSTSAIVGAVDFGPAAPMPQKLYYEEADAASYLEMASRRALQNLRLSGKGPRYRRHGRRIVYLLADLDAWSALHAFDNTAQERERKEVA